MRWFDVLLWAVTRGIVAALSLVLAGMCAMTVGRVPLFLNDAFLWSLRVYPAPPENHDGIHAEGGISVFDHPTFFDHAVLMQRMKRTLRFMVKPSHLSVWPLYAIARSVGCFPASFHNLSSELADSNGPIFVAPDPYHTGRFHTGAFRASDVVTPVIIAYHPEFVWKPMTPLLEAIAAFVSRKRIPTFYRVTTMQPHARRPNEDPADFAERIRQAMVDAKWEGRMRTRGGGSRTYWCDGEAYQGCWILVASSAACFFAPALFGSMGFVARIAIGIQGIASVLYHATGDPRMMKIDIVLRNILAPSFGLFEIVARNNGLPALCGLFAAAHFASGIFHELEHAFLVHLPVMIGFFSMSTAFKHPTF